MYITPSGHLFLSHFGYARGGGPDTTLTDQAATLSGSNGAGGTGGGAGSTHHARLFHPEVCEDVLDVLGVDPLLSRPVPRHTLPPAAVKLMDACVEAFAALHARSHEIFTLVGASSVSSGRFRFVVDALLEIITPPPPSPRFSPSYLLTRTLTHHSFLSLSLSLY